MSHFILPPAAVDYPSSDGRPLAENDAQLAAILYAVGALRVYFAGRADVYVSGDLLIYSETLGLELELRAKGGELRFRDPATGRNLLSHHEEHAARQEEAAARRMAESRAGAAGSRAKAAEARIAELEALLGGRRR